MRARVAVAAHYAGHDGAYVRLRFEGNGKSVAFWDADACRGMVMIEDQMHPLDEIAPTWCDGSACRTILVHDAVRRSTQGRFQHNPTFVVGNEHPIGPKAL